MPKGWLIPRRSSTPCRVLRLHLELRSLFSGFTKQCKRLPTLHLMLIGKIPAILVALRQCLPNFYLPSSVNYVY
jgi:hypothetical protein